MFQVKSILKEVLSNIDFENAKENPQKIESEMIGIANTYLRQVPKRFKKFVSLPVQKKSFEILSEGDSIFVGGQVGTGKTSLAFAMGYQWVVNRAKDFFEKKGDEVFQEVIMEFETAIGYIFQIRNAFRSDSPQAVRRIFSRAGLLILDDLFVSKTSDNIHEEIIYLLNERYQSKRPSIITSNKTLEEIAEIDDRIASRLSEGLVLDIDNEQDHRLDAK